MTDSYELRWKRSAVKDLRRLPANVVRRVLAAVEALPADPMPRGTRRLVGSESTFRLRLGSYRVIYAVLERQVVIEVIRVRHRKDAYR